MSALGSAAVPSSGETIEATRGSARSSASACATAARGARPRERPVEAAVGLIAGEGLDALSMRRLGSALGVEAMSLYRHFPAKTALLDAVVARLLGELAVPAPTVGPWQPSFRALARAYRALLARHPKAIPPLASLELSNAGS